jgi:hypothetical protein
MMFMFGRRRLWVDAELEWSWCLSAKNAGNIKKSGKLLNCSMAWKAGLKVNSGTMCCLIASTVFENSSIAIQAVVNQQI